jgi:hypothetical protein
MSNFLSVLRIIVGIFPAVIALVKSIEEHAPVPGLGSSKLELLKGIVDDTYSAAAGAAANDTDRNAILAAVVSIASRVVGFLKAIGAFK